MKNDDLSLVPCLILVPYYTKDWIQRSGFRTLGEEKEPSEISYLLQTPNASQQQPWSSGPAFSHLTSTLQLSVGEWVTQPAYWCTPITPLTFIFCSSINCT